MPAGTTEAEVTVLAKKMALRDVSEDQQQAIVAGHCCGKNGAELRCQLCRWSPTYLPVLRVHTLKEATANEYAGPGMGSGAR